MVTLLRPVEKGEDCINVVSGENIEYQDGLFLKNKVSFLSGETKNSAMSAGFAVLYLSAPTRVELTSSILQTNLSMDQKTRFISFILRKYFKSFPLRLWMLRLDTWWI